MWNTERQTPTAVWEQVLTNTHLPQTHSSADKNQLVCHQQHRLFSLSSAVSSAYRCFSKRCVQTKKQPGTGRKPRRSLQPKPLVRKITSTGMRHDERWKISLHGTQMLPGASPTRAADPREPGGLAITWSRMKVEPPPLASKGAQRVYYSAGPD